MAAFLRTNSSLAGVVALVFEVMPGARVKDWTTIKGRMEPEGTKKTRDKNEGRVEKGGNSFKGCRDAVQY